MYSENDLRNENLRERSGKSAERGSMGEVDLPRKEKYDEYPSFRDSLKLAKEHQPWEDPTNPSPLFAKKLREAVLGSMRKLPAELHKNLKFYTAVGSPLDQYHGVDAFVEFGVMGKDPIRVTLDVTMKPGKPKWKADILFSVGNIDPETFIGDISDGKFDDVIDRVGKSIGSFIFNRLTNRPTEKIFVPEKIQEHEKLS